MALGVLLVSGVLGLALHGVLELEETRNPQRSTLVLHHGREVSSPGWGPPRQPSPGTAGRQRGLRLPLWPCCLISHSVARVRILQQM